jgi:hypothetical protein
MTSLLLFVVAAVLEIAGCFAFWKWVRQPAFITAVGTNESGLANGIGRSPPFVVDRKTRASGRYCGTAAPDLRGAGTDSFSGTVYSAGGAKIA